MGGQTGPTLIDPATEAFSIVPGSGTLARVPRALWIGTGGNLSVVMMDDQSDTPVLLENIPSGTQLAIRPKKILGSGTTADAIVGLV